MKSMWPPSAAILFYDLFVQGWGGGAWPPRHPPGSATELSCKTPQWILISGCVLHSYLPVRDPLHPVHPWSDSPRVRGRHKVLPHPGLPQDEARQGTYLPKASSLVQV